MLAGLAPELATVFGALVMLGLAVPYLRQPGTWLDWRPWLPYAALALLLLLPKLLPLMRVWLGWELAFTDMFGSGIGGSIRPLQSPFVPFVAVGLAEAARQDADLLIVVARQQSLLGSLFHRSITAQLIAQSPLPVLVLPAED